MSIRVARLESLCRFGWPDSNRVVDSGRLARIGPVDSSRWVDSCRPTRIAFAIRVIRAGRRESLHRFGSPDANRLADSRRPTRIAHLFRVSQLDFFSIRVGRLGSFSSRIVFQFGPADPNKKKTQVCRPERKNIRNVFRFRFESVYRFGPAGSHRFVDSRRPTLIALSIRVARRPTRIALSIRVTRNDQAPK